MSVRPDVTARHLEARAAERQQRAAARVARLLERLPQARSLLTSDLGGRRVWLFGSLATGTWDVASDVDLAVEGLAAGNHMDALAQLMTLFGAPVDLVRLEEAPQSLRARIASEGREL
jgi:predicted nucleotidyltransferase